MDRSQQSQRERTQYIGSSDIAAIVGASRYRGALDVYKAKAEGHQQPDNEFMRWGRVLEEPVLREFCSMCDIKTYIPQVYAQHPDYDYLGGTVDAITDDFVIEIKTTSVWNKSFDDKIPNDYYIQCQWLMGLHKRDLTQVAVLFGGQRLEKYEVEFNQKLFDMLVQEAVKFWTTHVIPNVPPEDTTKVLLEVSKGDNVEADEKDYELVTKYHEFKRQADELMALADKAKDEIFECIGTKEGLVYKDDLLAKRTIKTRTSYDTKGLPSDILDPLKKVTQFVERKVY